MPAKSAAPHPPPTRRVFPPAQEATPLLLEPFPPPLLQWSYHLWCPSYGDFCIDFLIPADFVFFLDINECATGEWALLRSKNTNTSCASSRVCVNINGSFLCCPSGYNNPDQQSGSIDVCKDINECTSGAWALLPSSNTGKGCLTASVCMNTVGSFLCCPDGYNNPDLNQAGSIASCADINECLTGEWFTKPSSNTKKACASVSSCVNSNGSFFCCDPGFENPAPERTGNVKSMCQDVNECTSGQWATGRSKNTGGACSAASACVNTAGQFLCCPPGYRNLDLDKIGTVKSNCFDIDECALAGRCPPGTRTDSPSPSILISLSSSPWRSPSPLLEWSKLSMKASHTVMFRLQLVITHALLPSFPHRSPPTLFHQPYLDYQVS